MPNPYRIYIYIYNLVFNTPTHQSLQEKQVVNFSPRKSLDNVTLYTHDFSKRISRVCSIYEVYIPPSREHHRSAQKHGRPENEIIVPFPEFLITFAQTLANKFRNTLLHLEANLLAVLLTYSATPQNYLLFFTRSVLVTTPFRRGPLSIIPLIPPLLSLCEKIILPYYSTIYSSR